MKLLIVLVLMTLASASQAADINFNCGNPPATVWGEYYTVLGSTKDFSELKLEVFGKVEGSTRAQEEEPVNTIGNRTAKPNLQEKARSAQWKDAIPFDLTSTELGKAILYMHPSEFATAGSTPIVRLKIDGQDLRLNCSVWH